MTFIEKIKQKSTDIYTVKPLTIAFLGDSVTQGCFELYPRHSGGVGVVYDNEAVYHNVVRKILNLLYPQLPLSIVNAGICGATARQGRERLDTDVISYHPDLTVVCYGLNDCKRGMGELNAYIENLTNIFERLKKIGSEVIFMTPNMIGERVNESLIDAELRRIASEVCTEENQRTLDAYLKSAIALCEEKNVAVCDCYKNWKAMKAAGVDVTSMLSNDINHPTRELHIMFAYELVKAMLRGE